jgi:hypothetical protein
MAALDGIQRKAARMLLGHSSRSPVPSALAELGWTPWSDALLAERVGLLRRLVTTSSAFCTWVLEASAMHEASWVRTVALELQPWCGDGLPVRGASWSALRRLCLSDRTQHAVETSRGQCFDHPRLFHYTQVMWQARGVWEINKSLYNKNVPARMATQVSRWLVGGQGLRGGDCAPTTCATPSNCCLPCLCEGTRVAESLHHVLLICPLHQERRATASALGILDGGCRGLAYHHRDRWTWQQLRQIRELIVDMAAERLAAMPRGGRGAEQAEVLRLWLGSG